MEPSKWLKGYRSYLVLILLGCLFYLPGLKNLPVTDRDEARFAQASRQMLETGNFIDIRFQHTPRYKKPIGIYWLQAACAALAGGPKPNEIWPYRLPSFFGALVSVLLTFYFSRFFFGSREGFISAVLLGSSLLLNVEARLATTDAMLLMSIVLMQGMLGMIYVKLRRKESVKLWMPLVFWAACGIGILLKGPIPFVIALLTTACLCIADRNLELVKGVRPLIGIPLMVAIVLPWFITITLMSKGAFLKKAVGSDLLPKLIRGQESHGAPPGYYLFLFPALFWPASLVVPWAIWVGWKMRKVLVVRFLLAWILPTWVLLEVIPTKLPHYILPVFPALAILTGGALYNPGRWVHLKRLKSFVRLKKISALVWVAVSISLGGFVVFVVYYFNRTFFAVELFVILGICFLLVVGFAEREDIKPGMVLFTSIVGCLFVVVPAFSLIIPRLKGPWISRDVARYIRTLPEASRQVLVSTSFKEPSLVFLVGTSTQFLDINGAMKALVEGQASLALVGSKSEQAFKDMAEKRGVNLVALRKFRGFNYSHGKWTHLTLYKVVRKG